MAILPQVNARILQGRKECNVSMRRGACQLALERDPDQSGSDKIKPSKRSCVPTIPHAFNLILAHHTAIEYLKNCSLLEEPQAYLASTCMVYMSFDTFSTEQHTRDDRDKRLEEYPFLKYAVDHWGSHVFQCHKNARVGLFDE